MATEKTRYSDEELQEFKQLILQKLDDAKAELINLQGILNSANTHGTDDTASTFKILEDGSETLAKEEAGQLAARQNKFIEQLENALIRIENKTYGICRVTGKLIPKERLRAVPHTTQSMEAKLQQYKD
jgi:DnaK suppressor protein